MRAKPQQRLPAGGAAAFFESPAGCVRAHHAAAYGAPRGPPRGCRISVAGGAGAEALPRYQASDYNGTGKRGVGWGATWLLSRQLVSSLVLLVGYAGLYARMSAGTVREWLRD